MDSDRPILIEPINGGVYKEVEVKVLEKNPNEDAIVVLKKTKDIDTGLGIEIPIYEKIDYKYGDTIAEEGEYIVVLADAAYNISYAKFTVDRSKPTFNIDNNGIYKEVTLEVYDTATTVTVISKESLPNIYVPTLKQPGNLITEEGKYQAVSTDIAGNVSTIYFTIDRSNPEITNIVDGVAYNKITPAIEDANKVTATLNGEEYVIGTEIATNGTYTLVATDVAGNTAMANFCVSRKQ